MPVPPPEGLCALVKSYDGKDQAPVPFPVTAWEQGLESTGLDITGLLRDERYTCPGEGRHGAGHRTVTRPAIQSACAATDLENTQQVLSVFVLIMAWGSGTRASRGIRNTRSAVRDLTHAHAVLAQAAKNLRRPSRISDHGLQQAHAAFTLAGVKQAFFTKWFAFAGYLPGRTWQPLILDRRVYRTLNDTLRVDTPTMAGSRYRAARYEAYVGHLHDWADSLTARGCSVDAGRLEWIFFEHNGKPPPPP